MCSLRAQDLGSGRKMPAMWHGAGACHGVSPRNLVLNTLSFTMQVSAAVSRSASTARSWALSTFCGKSSVSVGNQSGHMLCLAAHKYTVLSMHTRGSYCSFAGVPDRLATPVKHRSYHKTLNPGKERRRCKECVPEGVPLPGSQALVSIPPRGTHPTTPHHTTHLPSPARHPH